MKSLLRPLKNAGIVGVGKATQGVVSLFALALAARQLGVETFGQFALIHALVFGLSQILRFQTWQAVLRFGADALEKPDNPRLYRIIRFTFTLDLLAAGLGASLMIAVAGALVHWLSLPDEQTWLARMYGLSIVFMLLTPSQLGVLRLFNRFDLVSLQTIAAPVTRLAGAGLLFLFVPDAGLAHYLGVWMLGTVGGRYAMFHMARRVLDDNGHTTFRFRPTNPLRAPEPRLWHFILGHHLFRSLQISQEPLSLLLVGWLLGPAAAGVFRIAQEFAGILVKPSEKLLVPALYPEIARLNARGETILRGQMITRNLAIVCSVALGLFVLLAVSGEWLIGAISGADYVDAYLPMLWLCGAGLVTIAAYPLEPLLSAAGRVRPLVLAHATGLAVHVTALYVLARTFGLEGAAAASLVATASGALILLFVSRQPS